MTCPGCKEEIFLEELVSGRCPLCGCSLDDVENPDEDFDEILSRDDFSYLLFEYFVFSKLDKLGADPVRIQQMLSEYEDIVDTDDADKDNADNGNARITLPLRIRERVLPRHCQKCNHFFMRGGSKVAECTEENGLSVYYLCPSCSE